MQIFYAAPSTAHLAELPDLKLWEMNLLLPLRDLGHDVIVFDFDYSGFYYNLDPITLSQYAFIQANRPRLGEALLDQVRTAHNTKPVDLFFSYFYSAYVDPQVIRGIGSMGIKTVNWYCNASYQFHLVEEIAPAYDYCLVPEKFRLRDYERVGAHPIYFQEAANPQIYHPYEVPVEYEVTFVGQRYGNRSMFVRNLLDAGIDVRVWGPGWRYASPLKNIQNQLISTLKRVIKHKPEYYVPLANCGGPLTDDELIRMYSRSKISLGFATLAKKPLDGGPDKQVRLRDFEAPMSGAFYLVEYFNELADFFEPGKEIETFRSPGELVEKAKYYLSHDLERERIRQAGLARARRDHTWHQRFEMVFNQIGLA